MQISDNERKYINYLNEQCNCPDYGLLMFKGDPITFEIGMKEWLNE